MVLVEKRIDNELAS